MIQYFIKIFLYNSAITWALDCNTSGVATVEGKIYDQNNTYLTGVDPWNCEAHADTIENVPAGSNRKAEILGKNPSYFKEENRKT